MNRYTVKLHRPLHWSIAIIGLSTIAAVITWFVLDKSHWSLIYDHYDDNEVFRSVVDENRRLEDMNLQLRERTLMMREMDTLDKKTAIMLQDQIRGMQEEIFKLKQELEFYRGIMDGARVSTGLNIQGLNIRPLSNENVYRLNLVLTHVAKSDKVAEGTIDVSLEGERNGNASVVKLKEVALESNLDLLIKFRNFKKIECDLILPDDFTPIRVKVLFIPKNSKKASIQRIFEWSVS